MLWRTRPGRSSRAPRVFIDPCLPTVAAAPPAGPGWVHEIKHDGYRLQIHKRAGLVRLFTRTGVDWTERYPWIARAAAQLKAESAIIDGEAVYCRDADGVTDFDVLHARGHDPHICCLAFDLLELNGEDLRKRPLIERKARLEQLVQKLHKFGSTGIRYVGHLDDDGPLVFKHACKLGLEGIVSKRAASPYRSGRAKTWIKVKNKLAPAYMRMVEGTF